eukprot:gene40630-53734_t
MSLPNPFNTLQTFSANGTSHKFYSLPALAKLIPNVARLPVSLRIVLESVLRNCDGKKVTTAHVEQLAAERQADAAVLRHAAFGDIEPRHHLDAADHHRRDMRRHAQRLAQHARRAPWHRCEEGGCRLQRAQADQAIAAIDARDEHDPAVIALAKAARGGGDCAGAVALLFLLPDAPQSLLVSRELDLYPALHPEKSDLIDGAIGALSSFDDTFGYHADGVGPETAVMPVDWMQRASLHYVGELTVVCPELHDLTLSKCVAGREKDADFVRELLRLELVSPVVLRERAALLDAAKYPVAQIGDWIERRRIEAGSDIEWTPLPGALEAVARLNHAGWHVVIASNQSGLGRGLFDMASLNAMHAKMHKMLAAVGGRIDAVFYCPHSPDEDCDCRKPKAGMFEEIAKRFKVSLKGVPTVGDSLRDLQ